MFTDNEKKLLKILVEKELEEVGEKEEEIRPDFPDILGAEEKYDDFLKKLLEKLK